MIGLIGGTGVELLQETYPIIEKKVIKTEFGDNPEITILDIENHEVAYMPRHKSGHNVPPHKINYKANIDALKQVGTDQIYATNSVGSMDKNILPGNILIPDNFIDFTKQRKSTFFDDKVIHIDCTDPYCKNLRENLIKTGVDHPYGIYIATEGPRFETGAEIQFYKQIGGKVVGMTGVPEVVLARERELCYASICAVTNYAASISENKLTINEVVDVMNECQEKLLDLLTSTIKNTKEYTDCGCKHILNGAVI